MNTKKNRQVQGFSLIEIMIFLAIMGIITAMILATFNSSRERARDNSIRNSVVQVRWLAEIVYDSQGASYLDWSSNETIQDQLTILLEDINHHSREEPGAPYVTVISDGQRNNYCVSAPLRQVPGTYSCIDTTGELQVVNNPCPTDVDEEDDPLRCADLM